MIDLARVPGALEEHKERKLSDGGLIEFERAPEGWLTASGSKRERDHRAYYFTPPKRLCAPCEGTGRLFDRSDRGRKCPGCGGTGNASRRARFPSVSSVLDAVCPKPGLDTWAEARGIEGAVEAIRRGLIDLTNPDQVADAVEIVRRNGLGADAARRNAAMRGLNVHALLEAYMVDGTIPQLRDHPLEHHAYIRGLSGWLADVDPEPESVEEMVCSPTLHYAGRMDFRGRMHGGQARGHLASVDFKSQEKGYVFRAAHCQVNLYDRAAVECGSPPAERLLVVVIDSHGRYREILADHPQSFTDAAIRWLEETRPVDGQCAASNRRALAEHKRLEAVAA